MDANGLRFWMLSRREDWPWTQGTQGLQYCASSNRLQLLSLSNAGAPAENKALAASRLDVTPFARDRFDNYARWDPSSGHVVAGGSGPGEVPIYAPPPPQSVTDLVLGYDGILYVAVGGGLVLVDRRERWPNFTLRADGFTFWRLAALPGGGVLALDQSAAQLGKVAGQPLRAGPIEAAAPGVLRSCDVNPNRPHISARYPLPPDEKFVALAALDAGQFALLSWGAAANNDGLAFLRTFDASRGLSAAIQLGGVRWPYALASIGDRRVATLATNSIEALIFDLAIAANALLPAGESFVLNAMNCGPFVHSFTLPPYYAGAPAGSTAMFPLLPLSLNSFAAMGETDPMHPVIFDSGASRTIWHRMFLEAVIPPRCGLLVWLTASDTPSDLTSTATRWFPHVAGDADLSAVSPDLLPDIPRAVWQSTTPEVAFAPALLDAQPVRDRQGLFMLLLQRAGKAVRNITGRYIGVRVQLNGDGRNTPELAAMRVYASRFSYVAHYLPVIYREDAFDAQAERDGQSTQRDFLERFVNLFEAQLTRIEDRVANAYLLTRPESAPDDGLDWLGSWIGIEPSAYPPGRRRTRLAASPDLCRQRGTVKGLTLALDVATDGMCGRGAIIVVEDYRLRHTFATILGADLSIKNDPLLPGYSASSNSILGDTLFLGDSRIAAQLQALYEKNLNLPGGMQQAAEFYDALANRMTIFVHDGVESVDVSLVQRIVQQEKPAHVAATIQGASQAFMIGLASLVGVNTYLAPEPPLTAAAVGGRVGRYGVVTNLPSLDPRLENHGVQL